MLTLFASHTNKKQYLDTLHMQKKKKCTIGCTIMTLIYPLICQTTNPKSHKLRKQLESSSGHTLNFYSNLVKYRFKNMLPRKIPPGVLLLSTLQMKEGQIRSKFRLIGLENSYTPSTSKACPSIHRIDYKSCAWPFYILVQIFPTALHSN